jgi:predicted ATPase
MIYCIEVKNYRSLKYIRQTIHDFQVMIGANASGKTTFLDVIRFISDIVQLGIDEAISRRAPVFQDLTFLGKGGTIQLALEIHLPDSIREKLSDREFSHIRYEMEIGMAEQTGDHAIIEESAILLKENAIRKNNKPTQMDLFPTLHEAPDSILNKKYKYRDKHSRGVFRKNPGGNDNFYDETQERKGKGWMPSFKFGIKKTALRNLPDDATKFPASSWMKEFLTERIQIFILDSQKIRKASPPGQSRRFKPDGSNLPWVIDDLKKVPKRFERWLAHLKTALPDITDIEIIERPEDRHKYIRVHYSNGGKIPSWLVSDGTLRLFALTIIAYLPDLRNIFLIEEPENGIHPKAIETVYQSLSSVYGSQILLASHSPIILSMVQPHDVLCFAMTKEGITDIVSGADHPKLKNWKGTINLSDLFAGGILG